MMSKEENIFQQLELFKHTSKFLRFQLDSTLPRMYTSMDESTKADFIEECENLMVSAKAFMHLKQVVGANFHPTSTAKVDFGGTYVVDLRKQDTLEDKFQVMDDIEENACANNVSDSSRAMELELYPRLIKDMTSQIEANGKIKNGFYCGVCNIISMSSDVWQKHIKGHDHIKRMKTCEAKCLDLQTWSCHICDLLVFSEMVHIHMISESDIHKCYDYKVQEIQNKNNQKTYEVPKGNKIVRACRLLNEAIAAGKIEGGFYCRFCDAGIESRNWESHKQHHNKGARRNVEKVCSLCPSGVFIDKKFVDVYMAYHHQVCHPMVTQSREVSRTNSVTSTSSASRMTEGNVIVYSFTQHVEAEFRQFQELRRYGNMLASAGFCWVCQKIFKNMFEWIDHTKAHPVIDGSNIVCEICDLAYFGPESTRDQFFKNDYHIDLDETIDFLRC